MTAPQPTTLDLSGFTPRYDPADLKLRDVRRFVGQLCADLAVFTDGFTAANMDARTLAGIDELDTAAQGAADDIFARHGAVDSAAEETEHPADTTVYGDR